MAGETVTEWNVRPGLEEFCRCCHGSSVVDENLRKLLSQQLWSRGDRRQFLEALSGLLGDAHQTAAVCRCFRPLVLPLSHQAARLLSQSASRPPHHQRRAFVVSLCRAMHLHPELARFVGEYLEQEDLFSPEEGERRSKKHKGREMEAMHALALSGEGLRHKVSLRMLLEGLNSTHRKTVWLAANAAACLLHLNVGLGKFLRNFFTSEEIRSLSLQSHFEVQEREAIEYVALPVTSAVTTSPGKVAKTQMGVVSCDLDPGVVEVEGILLPKVMGETKPDASSSSSMVLVPSMRCSLRSLALAVAAGSPALLQGATGCGKTSLVEHLAARTGRHGFPHLLKVQLSEQTDSKMLLGTYCCTEVPGEFVWRPGVLARAVEEGRWVVLEDVDFAPMDVVSVLLPLLETRTLSLPGHGDVIHAAPGFRLFATQRLLGSRSGWFRQRSGGSSLLEKLWTKVNVELMTREELALVIRARFPSLEKVVDTLLNVFFLLGGLADPGDGRGVVGGEGGGDPDSHLQSLSGRLISIRDLMTLCARITADFAETSSMGRPVSVFKEAFDCFAACLPRPAARAQLAASIGSGLGIGAEMVKSITGKQRPAIEFGTSTFSVGRVHLERKKQGHSLSGFGVGTFSATRLSLTLLEQLSVCVARGEPVLLVGETGTGKTSTVQYLAAQLGHKLRVVNMNQQSDSSDLLGGFKPVDLCFVMRPFREEYETLFRKSFSASKNAKFLDHIQTCFSKKRWKDLLGLMGHTCGEALKKFPEGSVERLQWEHFRLRHEQLSLQMRQLESSLAFSFIEGTLVKALQAGDWVLLDEINLAAAETLDCLSGLLEDSAGSIVLTERGDLEPVKRHQDFRLFACMNPATDVGKKDLTPGIRNRFTELYVGELEEEEDLALLCGDYLGALATPPLTRSVVRFFLEVKRQAAASLSDGTGHRPHYSLRTLCRALRCAVTFSKSLPRKKAVYEGLCLSFLTQLDRASHGRVEALVGESVLGKGGRGAERGVRQQSVEELLKRVPPGELPPRRPDNYIITDTVRANLQSLVLVVSGGQHPVLLQGETSVGKTSLISFLAASTGHRCLRVNNHEHTDLQEYVGCYAADDSGKLVFKEGVLVEAMRQGHWIILDELNLAPTDVLEALNRLLDDNRELFIPETQTTVKAHPRFMLFATQNPPGHYGGRKMLSRAFRNRFVELHFDELPSGELVHILHRRCEIPESYALLLVRVMLELQKRRRGSGVFAGKQGFMTLRDLFRWAERYHKFDPDREGVGPKYDLKQHLADHGYMLLAGRVRKAEEAEVIREVISKEFRKRVEPGTLYTPGGDASPTNARLLGRVLGQEVEGFQHVVWTHSMRRLAVLIGHAIQYREPVLLVGETGCGKTTVCQLFAALRQLQLYSVNCHLHTESADFLGGLRPVRSQQEEDSGEGRRLFEWVDGPLVRAMREGSFFLVDEISLADDSVLERLNSVLEPEQCLLLAERGGSGDGSSGGASSSSSSRDSVESLTAKEGFQVLATMNPGGDFGKKELSPALRNRFTEIWCPAARERQDLIDIIEHNLHQGIGLCNREDGTSGVGSGIMDFLDWFSATAVGRKVTVSIRDILTWVQFINTCARPEVAMETGGHIDDDKLDPAVAYIHGACLVFLDGLGSGTTQRGGGDLDSGAVRAGCLQFLLSQVRTLTGVQYQMADLGLASPSPSDSSLVIRSDPLSLAIPPFSIRKGTADDRSGERYALQAPTTYSNAQRVLRALQLPRPLLLEGSPGVGKTSLVAAIARAAQRHLVRINLSEQTDVTDLFGADLPVEGAEGGRFAWRDGPLLQALKAGHWIVLDELNLASQSVLEGLNACLDHRAEVFIPELARSFRIQHEHTRIFACQNPLFQGGGRKGLPRSFLNRFTQVYIEPLSKADLVFIAGSMYPSIPAEMLNAMVDFNMEMHRQTVANPSWGSRGGPWEFNLRDLFRWCDLLLAHQSPESLDPGQWMDLIYRQRLRTVSDRQQVLELYGRTVGEGRGLPAACLPPRCLQVTESFVQVGQVCLPRVASSSSSSTLAPPPPSSQLLLHQSLEPLAALASCVSMGWMAVLVGGQASGKSSIVQLLATLTGHTLDVLPMNSAMDTTELLGGFEQADVSRHVEEAAAQVERCLRRCQREILVELGGPSLALATALEEEWTLYSSRPLMKRKPKTTTEELAQLRQRVDDLLSVTFCLKKAFKELGKNRRGEDAKKLVPTELTSCDERLSQLKSTLKSARPGQGGGVFEWVDSTLVKALQSGHWLLIDNVNFCSPSVLDRLNALLEPRGVLSINERGVLEGGQVPTVTPHPDFRLFLAMDPKYGEISRAMRNRGIEIYIPGEEDGCGFPEQDLRCLLQGLGLGCGAVCEWLLQLHAALRSRLQCGERPALCHLLQAATLTVQQERRGIALPEALRHAVTDVYVRSQRVLARRQVAEAVLGELCEGGRLEGLASAPKHQPLLGLWPAPLPPAPHLTAHCRLASLPRKAGVLVHLLCSSQPSQGPRVTLHKLRAAMNILISQTSRKDWKLACDWLRQMMTSHPPRCQEGTSEAGEEGWSVGMLAEQAPDLVSASLTELFRHPCMDQLQQLVSKLAASCPEAGRLLSEQPWDLAGHRTLVSRAQLLASQAGLTSAGSLRSEVSQAVYRLHMVVAALTLMQATEPCLRRLQDICQTASGSRSGKALPLVPLLQLFSHLRQEVPGLLGRLNNVTMETLHQFYSQIHWLTRLLRVVWSWEKSAPVQEWLSLVTVHWNWFHTKTLPLFETLKLPAVLQTAIRETRRALGSEDKMAAAKRLAKFLQHWGHPAPPRSPQGAAASLLLSRLSQALELCGAGAAAAGTVLVAAKVKVITSSVKDVRLEILRFRERLLLQEDVTSEDLAEGERLQQDLQNYGLLEGDATHSQDALPSAQLPSDPAGQVTLWPLFDHAALGAELVLLGSMGLLLEEEGGVSLQPAAVSRLLQYELSHTPAVPTHLHLLAKLPSKEASRGALVTLTQRVLGRQWSSTLVRDRDRWLAWPQHSPSHTAPSHTAPSHTAPSHTALALQPLEPQGPEALHQSPVTGCVFALLLPGGGGGWDSAEKGCGGMQQQVSLGGMEQQLQQLEMLASHLWCLAPQLAAPNLAPRASERRILLGLWTRLLQALVPLLPSRESRAAADDVVSNLRASLAQPHAPGITAVEPLPDQLLQQEMRAALGDDALHGVLLQAGETIGRVVSPECDARDLGQGHVLVGLLLTHVLAPCGPVDPLHLQTLKLRHVCEELEEVEAELAVQDMHVSMTTGQHLAEVHHRHLHPRVQYLLSRQQALLRKREKLEKRKAVRPEGVQFQTMAESVQGLLREEGAVARVQALAERLSAAPSHRKAGQAAAAASTLLQEEGMWQRRLGKFAERLLASHAGFQDLTEPLVGALYQMKLGMRLLAHRLDTRQKQQRVSRHLARHVASAGREDQATSGESLGRSLVTLCSFPYIGPGVRSSVDLADFLLDLPAAEIIQAARSPSERSRTLTRVKDAPEDLQVQQLLCSVQLVQAQCRLQARLTPAALDTLCRALQQLGDVWAAQEERRRQEEEERAALYRYKDRTHGDERTEEEQIEAEFKATFPSFTQDYMDLADPDGVLYKEEEEGKDAAPSSMEEGQDEDGTASLSQAVMEEVWQTHAELFCGLAGTAWRCPAPPARPLLLPGDHAPPARPARLLHGLAAALAPFLLPCSEESVDSQVLGGHVMAVHRVLASVRPPSASPQTTSSSSSSSSSGGGQQMQQSAKHFDIYHDPAVAEVLQCRPVLDAFLARTRELLAEWPEHPVLAQLAELVERILSFPVTSPLMKFLVGLELLLEKAQDWESNATGRVSLMSQLEMLKAMIVQWRKLELSCWSQSLDAAQRRFERGVCRWWFHIFQLLQSFLASDPSPGSGDAQKSQTGTTEADLLKALRDFLEGSSVGEFRCRLQLILAFHCQLASMEGNCDARQTRVTALLWNLHQFYSQFLPAVQAGIQEQRAPLEEDFRGIVKIARWNDMNYWALRQTVEKSHRMVHKKTRAYEFVLQQPVKGMLGEKGSDSQLDPAPSSGGAGDLERFKTNTSQKVTTVQAVEVAGEVSAASDKLSRLSKLSHKLSRHWRSVVREPEYSACLAGLQEFVGDFIDTVHELQDTPVPQEEDKKKWKSQVKALTVRKRKALSELFKFLASLGLSYRKGQLVAEQVSLDSCLALPPLDVTAALTQHSVSNEELSGLWSGCSHYLYRSLVRASQYHAALRTPSQDLGQGELDRCHGFSLHLLHRLTLTHRQLAQAFTAFLQLSQLGSAVERLASEGSRGLPPHTQTRAWIAELEGVTGSLVEGLSQFLSLLQACPSQQTHHPPSPLPPHLLPPAALLSQGDDRWTEMFNTVQTMLQTVNAEKQKVLALEKREFFTWSDVEAMAAVLAVYRGLLPALGTVTSQFSDPESGCHSGLSSSLDFLAAEVSGLEQRFQSWSAQQRATSSDCQTGSSGASVAMETELATEAEGLVDAVLLAVQRLVKSRSASNHDDQEEKDGSTKEKKDDGPEGEEDACDGPLVKQLVEGLAADIGHLGIEQVVGHLRRLLEKTAAQWDGEGGQGRGARRLSLSLLASCRPLLQQYRGAVEFCLGHLVSLHRALGKMLSVLLAVFTELTYKGFCIPPELSEEMSGEGATEFDDMEGGGMGAGEGVKDVSDQIEGEDQLDEMKKPGGQQEEEQQADVAPEENAIEMTDDFDAKAQDLEPKEGEEEEEDKEGEEGLEEQMGDVGGEAQDKLDERMWGSDDEEEDVSDDKEKESGPGQDQKTESQLVTKDDDDEDEDGNGEKRDPPPPDDNDDMDEPMDDYDNSKLEPLLEGQQQEEQEAQPLDLPENLDMEGEEGAADNEEEQETGMPEDATEEEKTGPEEKTEPEAELAEAAEQTEGEETKEEGQEESKEEQNPEESTEEEKNEGEEEEEAQERGEALPEPSTEEREKEEEGSANDKPGTHTQPEEEEVEPEEMEQDVAKTSHDEEAAIQSQTAQNEGGQGQEQQEKVGAGCASADQQEGHEGQQSRQSADHSNGAKRKRQKWQPGQADKERTLGADDQPHKRLKTTEQTTSEQEDGQEPQSRQQEAELYQHVKEAKDHYDAQTRDAATAEQQEQQKLTAEQLQQQQEEEEEEGEVPMEVEEEEEQKEAKAQEERSLQSLASSSEKEQRSKGKKKERGEEGEGQVEVEGERVDTLTVERDSAQASIHTALQFLNLHTQGGEMDVEELRAELASTSWSLSQPATAESLAEAARQWEGYEAVTAPLSQELCEQLRLVLEPTQATKLRGDYRTGKRLNMRKVIAYVASQFRKDKIWLRRTKPSKRQYQILLAVDDSASMMENHSKQLAFESLALVANALTLLESGDLAICSFGQEMRMLHPFSQQFTNQSGAAILQQLTFEQQGTDMIALLKAATAAMLEQQRLRGGGGGGGELSQLLLIVSDGVGLYSHGISPLQAAIRQAQENHIFIVLVILDNPNENQSIYVRQTAVLDSSSEPGGTPGLQVKSYLETLPFPFYVVIRDSSSLPATLSDALRQWMELVSASDA